MRMALPVAVAGSHRLVAANVALAARVIHANRLLAIIMALPVVDITAATNATGHVCPKQTWYIPVCPKLLTTCLSVASIDVTAFPIA